MHLSEFFLPLLNMGSASCPEFPASLQVLSLPLSGIVCRALLCSGHFLEQPFHPSPGHPDSTTLTHSQSIWYMQGTALKTHQTRVARSGQQYKATRGNGRKWKNNDKTHAGLHFIIMGSERSSTKPAIKPPPCPDNTWLTYSPHVLESYWQETQGQIQDAPCLRGTCSLASEPTAKCTHSVGNSQQ